MVISILVVNDNTVRNTGSTGAFIETFVTSGSGGLDKPWGLSFGGSGHLYVASYSTNEVLKYDKTNGNFITDFVSAGSGGLTSPRALDFGPDGHLFVASEGTNEILKYDGVMVVSSKHLSHPEVVDLTNHGLWV